MKESNWSPQDKIPTSYFSNLQKGTKEKISTGCGGDHLLSQHSAGRGWWISEFEASMV